MGRYSRLHEIRRMDPARDYAEILRLISAYEFPWDYRQGVSVAFLRDYGVPRISVLLDRTQEFERAGQKRYDDTVLIGYEMAVDGFDSERGRAAARHLNRIHGKYRIPNDDFRYVLATTVVGPKRWIDRFGWRPLCAQEVQALVEAGRKTGAMMGIEGVPDTYEGFERLLDSYEERMFAYDPANRRVANATFRVIASWYPRPLRPLVARVALAVLDEPLLAALGFRPQPRWVRSSASAALRLRARCVRRLPARPRRFPARPRPRTYPFGWRLDDLGPHWARSRPVEPLPDETGGGTGGATRQRATAPDSGGRTPAPGCRRPAGNS
ncbi:MULTISPECIES: oxygenase MpaB family protein [unclassified Streptomyces]|uniref:oxygenase MpaB family protein n=1 Tax=unclassified Streptomyces TaxID=2593676 RepID=UPI002E76EA21|nr:oxygenase MpaB family protein [Streptomyces sp. JV184]MEE1748113.1 oxygenase MpaB family protein [Streptomyces sp. JV184]